MEERGVGGGAREHNKLGCVVNGEEHLSHHLAAAPLPLPSLTFTCMGPPQPPSQPRYIAPSHLPASHHLLPFPPSPYPFPSPHTFNPLSRSPPRSPTHCPSTPSLAPSPPPYPPPLVSLSMPSSLSLPSLPLSISLSLHPLAPSPLVPLPLSFPPLSLPSPPPLSPPRSLLFLTCSSTPVARARSERARRSVPSCAIVYSATASSSSSSRDSLKVPKCGMARRCRRLQRERGREGREGGREGREGGREGREGREGEARGGSEEIEGKAAEREGTERTNSSGLERRRRGQDERAAPGTHPPLPEYNSQE